MAARLGLLLASALLTGCERVDAPPAPPAAAVAGAAPVEGRDDLPEEQRSPDLFGSWLVVTITNSAGVPQDRYHDMILLVGSRQLEIISQCVSVGPFDYGRASGGGINIRQQEARLVVEGSRPPPPPVMCARARSPAERAAGPALLSASRVERRADGAVTLAGEQGALLLRRPPSAFTNPYGNSPPPPRPPLVGAWRFVAVNGRTLPEDERMELLLRPGHIEWRSGCVHDVRELTVDRDILRPNASDPFPVCERGRSQAEQAIERLLEALVVTRMSREGKLRLEGSGVTAELAPLTR